MPKDNNSTVTEMLDKIKEEVDLNTMEKSLTGNVFEFPLDGVKYRVSKPVFSQKQEAYQKKLEKFTELLSNSKIKLQKDLIAIYKERGIDVEGINDKINNLESERNNINERLGELLEKQGSESDMNILKDMIEDIRDRQSRLSIEKTQLLQYSLEYQLNVYIYSYLTTLIAEKEVDGKWVRVWNNYEEFLSTKDEKALNTIVFYATLLTKDEINF